MSFDVMISHSTADKSLSHTICERLELAGIRCWIAPRDIAAGVEWTAAILEGINSSRMMVLVFSESANASRHVQREILYATENKLPLLPFRIQNTNPTGSLAYCLLGVQWLDGRVSPPDQHIGALISRVRGILADLDKPPTSSAVHSREQFNEAAPVPKTHDIFFECEHCGKSMVIDLDAAGTTVNCIFCEKETNVPGPAKAAETNFDPATLAKITEDLGDILGPIARHLVKTTAKRSANLHDLCNELAEHISDQKERASFLDTVGYHARCIYVPPPAKSEADGQQAKADKTTFIWKPEVLKRIKSELAGYLGPVASLLVERASKETSAPKELYERLAANISSAKEREKWLQSGNTFQE